MATNTKMLELTFNVEGGSHHPSAGVFLRRSRHFAEKCEDRRNQRYRAGIGIRSDWYTAFGHRPVSSS